MERKEMDRARVLTYDIYKYPPDGRPFDLDQHYPRQ